MVITKQQLAIQLLNYLQRKISLYDLANWAESLVMKEIFREKILKLGYVLKIDAGLVA